MLGPRLFLLYINDLPNISSLLDFYLFADDTNLYYKDVSLISLEQKINKELKKLNLWLNVNRISLNIAKNNFVIFHPYNKPLKGRVTIVIKKLKDIFIFQISRFIHNCLRSKINNNFHNWFILNNEIHNYHTRSNSQIAFNIIVTNNLFIPIARTTHYGLKLTKVIGPKIWNSIPWEIRKITSICGFKKYLSMFLLFFYFFIFFLNN